MLPPGAVLPSYEAGGQETAWLGVEAGTLGATLEGGQRPYGFRPGEERRLMVEAHLPVLPPGTRATLRHAGAGPLALVRLAITSAIAPLRAAPEHRRRWHTGPEDGLLARALLVAILALPLMAGQCREAAGPMADAGTARRCHSAPTTENGADPLAAPPTRDGGRNRGRGIRC